MSSPLEQIFLFLIWLSISLMHKYSYYYLLVNFLYCILSCKDVSITSLGVTNRKSYYWSYNKAVLIKTLPVLLFYTKKLTLSLPILRWYNFVCAIC